MSGAAKGLQLMDIESIIDETEPAETGCIICVKGNLRSQHDQLAAQLDALPDVVTNLAGNSSARLLAEQMADLEEQMRAYNRTFVLRAVTPRRKWRNLMVKRPVKTPGMDDEQYADVYHPWLCEIVARSAVDPAMTAQQVERLADKLSDGDWQKLANAAWRVNDDSRDIPFSAAASVLSRSSGEKSKQPEPSDNPGHGSLAGNPAPSPSTSTEATGD